MYMCNTDNTNTVRINKSKIEKNRKAKIFTDSRFYSKDRNSIWQN